MQANSGDAVLKPQTRKSPETSSVSGGKKGSRSKNSGAHSASRVEKLEACHETVVANHRNPSTFGSGGACWTSLELSSMKILREKVSPHPSLLRGRVCSDECALFTRV